MIEEIEYALLPNVSPERLKLLIGALELLQEYNYTSYDFQMKQLIHTDDMIGTEEMVMGITNIISGSVDYVLRNLGLVNVTGDLTIKIDLLDGMKTLESYDDHDTLIAIIDEEQDPTAVLSALLELVTVRSWDDYALVLGEVPVALIERLEEVHVKLKNVEDGEEPSEDTNSPTEQAMADLIRKRVKEYVAKSPDPKQILIQLLLDDGYRLGLDFDHYLQGAQVQIESYGNNKDPKAAACNILSLALATPLSVSVIKKEINDRLDDLFTDMDFITSVDIALTDEMKKVIAYE